MSLEEKFTDQEFCKAFKINRATSLRWRDDGIVGYLKLPNGQIRYSGRHIEELERNFAKMEKLGVTLKDISGALKSGVVDVGVTEGRGDVGVTEDARDFSNRKPALHEARSAGMA